MLLRNLTTSLVNGSRGVVTGWLDDPLGHLPSIVHGNDRDHKAETIKRYECDRVWSKSVCSHLFGKKVA